MEKQDPLIHPQTGNEIQKRFYISVPYFPGLSESFKKIFKYTPVEVCFKGVNTLKSMLMHPKRQDLQQPKEGSSLPLGSVRQMGVTPHILEKLQGSRRKSQRTLQVYNICHTETLQGFPSPSSFHRGFQHN